MQQVAGMKASGVWFPDKQVLDGFYFKRFRQLFPVVFDAYRRTRGEVAINLHIPLRGQETEFTLRLK